MHAYPLPGGGGHAVTSAAAGAGFPRVLFWLALAVIAGVRFLWLVLYLVFARKRSPLTLLTSELYQGGDDERRRTVHQGVAAETNRLADTSLLVGALALAAWTALFVVADQAPASHVSTTSRSLLLVGAAVLIAVPIFFRVPDRHTTYIGRRSGQYIGFSAVGLAFASVANDLLGGAPGYLLAAGGTVALVLRDVLDTIGEIKDERDLLKPAASASSEDAEIIH
jgi:hypothetical protein